MVVLHPRLQSVAELVPACQIMADIGTDHAYVPLYLLQTGRIQQAVASDIHRGPALRAKENCLNEQAADVVSVRVGPGLLTLSPHEVEGAVIAGMGGLMICSILEEGAHIAETMDWFVLQPQNHVGDLRQWLAEHEYMICQERLASEKNYIYQVLLVRHGKMSLISPIEKETGLLLYRWQEPLFVDFLRILIHKQAIIIESVDENRTNEINRKKKEVALQKKKRLEEILWTLA